VVSRHPIVEAFESALNPAKTVVGPIGALVEPIQPAVDSIQSAVDSIQSAVDSIQSAVDSIEALIDLRESKGDCLKSEGNRLLEVVDLRQQGFAGFIVHRLELSLRGRCSTRSRRATYGFAIWRTEPKIARSKRSANPMIVRSRNGC
jgi:hypothetical protein